MQVSMNSNPFNTSYQLNHQSNTATHPQEDNSVTANSVNVSISTNAQALYEKENAPANVGTLPSDDQNIKEAAKAIAAYRAVSNLMDDSISMGKAYLIKNNDTARQFYVGKSQFKHQANMAETYLNNINNELV